MHNIHYVMLDCPSELPCMSYYILLQFSMDGWLTEEDNEPAVKTYNESGHVIV